MTALDNALQATQREPILGKDMVKNEAGGYVFKVSDWDVLNRFLLIGTEGGTYYTREKELTLKNVNKVLELIKKDSAKVITRAMTISIEGRAPKNDQAIFVLALCITFGDRKTALVEVNAICRTATHLFMLMKFLAQLNCGKGRSVKRAIANWYLSKSSNVLANQVVKYRNREGWSHKGVLIQSHPKTDNLEINSVLRYAVNPEDRELSNKWPRLIADFVELQKVESEFEAVRIIERNRMITHEMVPNQFRGSQVWKALLPNLPMTALIRNLPTMTRLNVLKSLDNDTYGVAEKLTSIDQLRNARIHPLNALVAGLTYQSGRSLRGKAEWEPVQEISSALDDMYVASYGVLPKIDKNVYIGVDVSGSMSWDNLMGVPDLTPCVASGALSLALLEQCNKSIVKGFSDNLVRLQLKKGMSLSSMKEELYKHNFGGTDCALPMLDAIKRGYDVDVFIVITDNQTWYGNTHPVDALNKYRKLFNKPNAKLIVLAMTASDYSIADPNDPNMLDIAGFDLAIPRLINEFIK